jgi:hypothetical protein
VSLKYHTFHAQTAKNCNAMPARCSDYFRGRGLTSQHQAFRLRKPHRIVGQHRLVSAKGETVVYRGPFSRGLEALQYGYGVLSTELISDWDEVVTEGSLKPPSAGAVLLRLRKKIVVETAEYDVTPEFTHQLGERGLQRPQLGPNRRCRDDESWEPAGQDSQAWPRVFPAALREPSAGDAAAKIAGFQPVPN